MNDNEQISAALCNLGVCAPQVQAHFIAKCTVQTCSKGEVLFSVGERNRKEYLLLDGVLRRYNMNERGEAVSMGFYLNHAVVAPHFSRTRDGKAIFALQALTIARVATIGVEDLDDLRQTIPDYLQFGRRIVESALTDNLNVEIAYRSGLAKDRLLLLRAMFPNLENLVPHHYIASYLGVTQVSFSRLRRELAGK